MDRRRILYFPKTMTYCNILLKKLRCLKFNEKRTFKIETIPHENVNDYVKNIARKFKRRQEVYDKKGRINYRFNILGNDEDIWIPVRSSSVAFQ